MASTRNTVGARPRLTARSVLASTLLGLDPPELRTAALVAGAELLGVSPGTARVAISRMVTAGELEPTADGGTRVVQRREAPEGISDVSVNLTKVAFGGVPKFNETLRADMQRTLTRIKADAERAARK